MTDAPATQTAKAAAMKALRTHEALVAAGVTEPEGDDDGVPYDREAWLTWHTNVYRPAYANWVAAMVALDEVKPGISRHPSFFRPACEQIIAEAGSCSSVPT